MATTSTNQNNATINLSKIECIPPKNTIATINQFILNTTDFINRFAYFSEEKLLYLDENVEKLETQLILLEKKLETIPAEYFANVNTQILTQISAPVNQTTDLLNPNPMNSGGQTQQIQPPGPPGPPTISQNPGVIAPPPLNLLLAGGKTLPPPPPPVLNNPAGPGQGGSSSSPVEQQQQGGAEQQPPPEEKKNEIPGF